MIGTVAARENAVAWDLRSAWASGRAVAIRFEDGFAVARCQGVVRHVAASAAFAVLDDGAAEPLHFPLAIVLSVRKPHFHEPLDRPATVSRWVPEVVGGEQLTLEV